MPQTKTIQNFVGGERVDPAGSAFTTHEEIEVRFFDSLQRRKAGRAADDAVGDRVEVLPVAFRDCIYRL